MRKELSFIAVILAYALLGWWMGSQMPVTTLTVGSGAITLVQNGALATGTVSNPVVTLPAASTAGTLLVAVLAQGSNVTDSVTSGPAGFVQAASVQQLGGDNTSISVWIYPNNPGGITAATFVADATLAPFWQTQISEWSGVLYTSPLDSTGTATATAGTTLTTSTTGTVTATPELVIAAWVQRLGANATVTYTSPSGYTRLRDNGSVSQIAHLDIEYSTTPTAGVIANPVLTSTGATFGAAGAIIVLKAAPLAVDMTAFVTHDTIHAKLNTLDLGLMLGGRYVLESATADGYQLEDGSGVYLMDAYLPQLGDPVVLRYSPT